jgi:hypothetical protein
MLAFQCVDDQKMDAQMIYVLGGQLLDALHDQCAALKNAVKMYVVQMYVVQMYVAYLLLALKNVIVRILELQYFHQLAFQYVA